MNPNAHNPSTGGAEPGSAEETLRLIASLPAPEGLELRVRMGLSTHTRPGRVLAWPMPIQPGGNWMRAAAAAAIVFVVAGGGWGVYSRVQPGPSAKMVVLPPRAQVPGGFSSAGAIRTPRTLSGPVLKQPAGVSAPQANLFSKKPAQAARSVHRSPAAPGKAASRKAAPPAK